MSATGDLAPDLVFLHILTAENGYLRARPIGGGRYACIRPLMFTHAIITGKIGDYVSINDQWCYHTLLDAAVALDAWDGTGEPQGWHRHPASGRRLAETEDCIDEGGALVPLGAIYFRG